MNLLAPGFVADPAPGSFAPPAILSSGRSKPRVALVHYWLVALRGGVMIAQGTPETLMQSDTLEHIYGIPMGILPHPAGAAPVSFVY